MSLNEIKQGENQNQNAPFKRIIPFKKEELLTEFKKAIDTKYTSTMEKTMDVNALESLLESKFSKYLSNRDPPKYDLILKKINELILVTDYYGVYCIITLSIVFGPRLMTISKIINDDFYNAMIFLAKLRIKTDTIPEPEDLTLNRFNILFPGIAATVNAYFKKKNSKKLCHYGGVQELCHISAGPALKVLYDDERDETTYQFYADCYLTWIDWQKRQLRYRLDQIKTREFNNKQRIMTNLQRQLESLNDKTIEKEATIEFNDIEIETFKKILSKVERKISLKLVYKHSSVQVEGFEYSDEDGVFDEEESEDLNEKSNEDENSKLGETEKLEEKKEEKQEKKEGKNKKKKGGKKDGKKEKEIEINSSKKSENSGNKVKGKR